MNKNCEECFALTILLENKLIGNDAKVSDRPDIISKNENIEVTSAIIGEIENRLHFGLLPKESEYTNMANYDCNSCEFLLKCKEERHDCIVYCKKCKDKHFWLRNEGFTNSQGAVCYGGGRHPITIPHSKNHYGESTDLEDAIRRKENKSINYEKQNLGLFLFYDKEIEKIKPITSSVFKNIYVFRTDDNKLYKNWVLIKRYSHGRLPNCYNAECNEYGKFNN